MEGGFTKENLDHGRPDWKSVYLEAAHDLARRQTLYGAVRQTERFDFRDTELAAGYYHPLGQRWSVQVEGSHSPEHMVLPQTSVFGATSYEVARGWILSGGLRGSQYTDTDARVLSAGLERYVGAYRVFYGVFNGKPQSAPSASAQRFGMDYYYGESNRV